MKNLQILYHAVAMHFYKNISSSQLLTVASLEDCDPMLRLHGDGLSPKSTLAVIRRGEVINALVFVGT